MRRPLVFPSRIEGIGHASAGHDEREGGSLCFASRECA
jgi:hypothetical protein